MKSTAVWSSVTDAEEEGVWRDYYSGSLAPSSLGYLDGGESENCAILAPIWPLWMDMKCSVSKEQPVQCACQKEDQIYMKLRGLCEASNIDKHWMVGNRHGEVVYYGIQNTEIRYDYNIKKWKMKTGGKPENTEGISGNSFDSFLLGRSDWYIDDDNEGEN